jgi:hypothetical protein
LVKEAIQFFGMRDESVDRLGYTVQQSGLRRHRKERERGRENESDIEFLSA